jgi:teichuronic acid biosynthesis glycosyltransferase TuaG
MSAEPENIKFTIVIPTYNAAHCIEQAIDSCLQQSYPHFEIIVVDDASTDNTEELLENKYAGRLRYMRLHKNLGSSAARNKALDNADGDFVAFLDADDMWHKDKLLLVENILSAQPGIRFLYHTYTLEDIDSKEIPEDITLFRLPFVKLLLTNVIATPCVVMRNNNTFRFEHDMRYMEDYDLWLRIGYKHKLYFINVPLTQIGRPVLSKGGVSAARWKMRMGEMKAYRRLIKLNVLFILLLPVLWVSSLLKHVKKIITG